MIPLLPAFLFLYRGPSIGRLVQSRLHDISFKAAIVVSNQHELSKISEDFGRTYRFDYAKVQMKEPFQYRIESVVQGSSVLAEGNGHEIMFKVPRAGISRRENVSMAPGRQQTFADFGILTPSLSEFFNFKFLRLDRATGDDVFDLTYESAPRSHDTTRFRIWVNPHTHLIDQKQWYGQMGEYRATFYFLHPKKVDGVWVPTELEVKNSDGALAGEMRFENIKVNTELPSSLFKF